MRVCARALARIALASTELAKRESQMILQHRLAEIPISSIPGRLAIGLATPASVGKSHLIKK